MRSSEQIDGVRRVVTTRMPTNWGVFEVIGFERLLEGKVDTAVVMMLGDHRDLAAGTPLLRVHSQCVTSEALGSLRCDCADQLEIAMRAVSEEGRGLIIYEQQEGRGIGLMAKLQAYALQDEGFDTVDANLALGFNADHRDFSLPAAILHELGISRVRLLSNNPSKLNALVRNGIEVVAQLSCEAQPNPHSLAYLRAKKERMGHRLSLEQGEPIGLIRSIGTVEDDQICFSTIETAIREMKAGRMVVVVDDEDRENEGDLTIAAEMVTADAISFMATHGRGLICLAMTPERIDELDLAPMVRDNTALGGTAFTVSIDAIAPGMTTGISSYDRAQTIKSAIDETCCAEDFARPGHVFPLCARAGGVLERRGQTEAAVDLASLAGLYPAGVICEIVNDDGTMARVPDLIRFCKKHGLVMVTVAELARYRFEIDFENSLGAIEGLFPVCPREYELAAH
jgi:3,4-dihydroxy-2-butanone 4-phosphate synthase/GTP cyclohydrolase II